MQDTLPRKSRRACSDPTGNGFSDTTAVLLPTYKGCAVCHNDDRYGFGSSVCGRCNRCHGCGSSNNGIGYVSFSSFVCFNDSEISNLGSLWQVWLTSSVVVGGRPIQAVYFGGKAIVKKAMETMAKTKDDDEQGSGGKVTAHGTPVSVER